MEEEEVEVEMWEEETIVEETVPHHHQDQDQDQKKILNRNPSWGS